MITPWSHYAVYSEWVWVIKTASTSHMQWEIIIEYSESIETMRKQLTERMYAWEIPYHKYIQMLDAITEMKDERWSIDPVSYAREAIEKLYSAWHPPHKSDIVKLFDFCLSQCKNNAMNLSKLSSIIKPSKKSHEELQRLIIALHSEEKLSIVEILRILHLKWYNCTRAAISSVLKKKWFIPIDWRSKRYNRK